MGVASEIQIVRQEFMGRLEAYAKEKRIKLKGGDEYTYAYRVANIMLNDEQNNFELFDIGCQNRREMTDFIKSEIDEREMGYLWGPG